MVVVPDGNRQEDAIMDLRDMVRHKYQAVFGRTAGNPSFPVGRESAVRLGYSEKWLSEIPGEVIDRFEGLGNPFRVRTPGPGDWVLDLGCGGGLDSFIAASMVGPEGRVVGLEAVPENLEVPRQARRDSPLAHLEFLSGSAGAIPFCDDSFDMVLANGALGLVPDLDGAFQEIARVLSPGGVFVGAELVAIDDPGRKDRVDDEAGSGSVPVAIPARAYLARFRKNGFLAEGILGSTGYATSRFNEGVYFFAIKGV